MRRVSGKISLATRRIWGDPEDEDEISTITGSGLKHYGSEFTTSIEEGGHTESVYNDGILPANDPRVSADCISFSDIKLRAKHIDSAQALEKDGELPIASKKSKSSLDEKHTLLSKNSDTPDEILYNSLTKATLPEQTDRDLKKNSDSSVYDSISSSVVCPPFSYHDAFGKDFALCNDTKLTGDHIEATQDLHKSMNISHQCSKINIEDQRVSEVMKKVENRFFASENSNPRENVTSTDGPYFDEHINNSVFENAVEDSSLIPVAIESKDLISENSDPSSNEGKTQLNYDAIELDNDNNPKIVPSKLNKLESCDEKISNNLENEISQVSALLEIENQLISRSSSEFHLQWCSKEIDDGNDTVHVAEPIIFNENCINQDYMSSSVTDLPDSLAVENKQNINEASDKKTSTNLDLSDEIICLHQALPLRSHLEPKDNARDLVSLDEDKSSCCTAEITEHTSVEFANPITSSSILNVAKDASDENNLVGLNTYEIQMRSPIIGIRNEEVDEGYTLITAHDNLNNKVRVSDTKFEDNHDCSRKSSNKYSDCTNLLLTNVQDSKESDNILSLSDGNGKYNYFQSSGLNLPDIVNQHTARIGSIAQKYKSPEYDLKTNNIHKGFEDTENLLEVNYTSKGEMFLNNGPNISKSAGANKSNLLDADNSNISVKDLKLDTEKYEVYLTDSNEVENGADEGSKNKNDEKIDEIIERIEDKFGDTSEHTTTDITTNNIVDTTADKIEDRNEDKTEENFDRIEDVITDKTTDTSTDTAADATADIIADNNVNTTAERIEDRTENKTENKAEEILDRIEEIITDTTADITADAVAHNNVYTTTERIDDRTEYKAEEKLEEITDRIGDTTTDATASRIGRNEDRIEQKSEEKLLEIISRIEDRTKGNAKDIFEDRIIEKVISQEKNQAGDDIESNFFKSEASKLENIGDKNDYDYSEAHGEINAHVTDLIISNDLKIESVVPTDQNFGKDNKKLPLEGAELSETEIVKATRNRKTWLRYVKSFEKRHEENDSSSTRLSSGRESSGQSERVDRGETIAFIPKIPETPMKKKYAPSHSDSITPEKRRRSFRKKIKEKISDTLHKLKD